GRRSLKEGLHRSPETGIKKDNGESQRPHKIGSTRVIELDPEPVRARGKSDAEKDQKQGGPEAERDETGKNRNNNQTRTYKDQRVNPVDHRPLAQTKVILEAILPERAASIIMLR